MPQILILALIVGVGILTVPLRLSELCVSISKRNLPLPGSFPVGSSRLRKVAHLLGRVRFRPGLRVLHDLAVDAAQRPGEHRHLADTLHEVVRRAHRKRALAVLGAEDYYQPVGGAGDYGFYLYLGYSVRGDAGLRGGGAAGFGVWLLVVARGAGGDGAVDGGSAAAAVAISGSGGGGVVFVVLVFVFFFVFSFVVLFLVLRAGVLEAVFECISEDCLQDAVDALERAKENDSIAYLRFHWRDPRIGNGERSPSAEDEEEDDEAEDEEEDEDQDDEDDAAAAATGNRNSSSSRTPVNSAITASSPSDDEQPDPEARSASTPQSSVSANTVAEVEVEAVVSCTSDGLVVILRKARGPRLPAAGAAGVFASPWAHTPLLPAQQAPSSGVPAHDFMESIRQVAVFAWSLRSINGEIMQHAQPGPKPDSSEKVGDFSKPGTTHWKRSREWEVAFGDRNAQLAEAERDSQYPDSDDEGKDKDLRHSNKKRVRGDDDA
ncbi:hypothetical protein FN846DRAFT_908184 [Sphaerosporella brunnea]|uniref:Uncharacterized protein n=1 Tax=Sphaerosporella brunnea TaxID=1250544 RepID=A0A5J5EUT0_9PEZI|nr:hypothetical protein FN846DRAFT_908184 [Sphaerosporella brunnea]